MTPRPPRSTLFPYRRSSDLVQSLRQENPRLSGRALLVADDGPAAAPLIRAELACPEPDRKSTRLNSSHSQISYAVFCLKKKTVNRNRLASRTSRRPPS